MEDKLNFWVFNYQVDWKKIFRKWEKSQEEGTDKRLKVRTGDGLSCIVSYDKQLSNRLNLRQKKSEIATDFDTPSPKKFTK